MSWKLRLTGDGVLLLAVERVGGGKGLASGWERIGPGGGENWAQLLVMNEY